MIPHCSCSRGTRLEQFTTAALPYMANAIQPHNFFVGAGNFLSPCVVFITVRGPPIMPPKFELTNGVPSLHLFVWPARLPWIPLLHIAERAKNSINVLLFLWDPCWKMAFLNECAGMSRPSVTASMQRAAWTSQEVLLIEGVTKKGTIYCNPNTLHYVP